MQKHTINIVGRYDTLTGIGQQNNAFLHTLKDKVNFNFINTRPQHNDTKFPDFIKPVNFPIDPEGLSIFTDVLSNGNDDFNYHKIPHSLIKLACVILDSTKIPSEWVGIINVNFDGVIVASSHLIKVLSNSGVNKPIFYLPIALEMDKLLKTQPKLSSKKPFTYFAAGLIEKRKNFHLLLAAFQQAFNIDDPSVRLILKLSDCIDYRYKDQYLSNLHQFNNTNIHIIQENLARADYLKLLNSADCLVSVSGGEGFSVIPREFMAMGKPLIVTDAFAQHDICETGLVRKVECEIPMPGYYPQINRINRYVGIQFEPYIEDIVDALKEVFNQKY